MGGAPRRLPPEEVAAPGRRDRAVLARLAAPVDLHRALAGDGRPLGHDAEADDLRAHRRAGRRADRRAARAGRRRAQLGLPLHLDPGRLVLHLRAARAGLHRGGRRVRRLAAGPGQRAAPADGSGAAEDHVPGRRQLRPDRGDPRPLRGLARLAPGAHRQRRRRPAAARHLRRGDGRRLPGRPARPADGPPGLDRDGQA